MKHVVVLETMRREYVTHIIQNRHVKPQQDDTMLIQGLLVMPPDKPHNVVDQSFVKSNRSGILIIHADIVDIFG